MPVWGMLRGDSLPELQRLNALRGEGYVVVEATTHKDRGVAPGIQTSELRCSGYFRKVSGGANANGN